MIHTLQPLAEALEKAKASAEAALERANQLTQHGGDVAYSGMDSAREATTNAYQSVKGRAAGASERVHAVAEAGWYAVAMQSFRGGGGIVVAHQAHRQVYPR